MLNVIARSLLERWEESNLAVLCKDAVLCKKYCARIQNNRGQQCVRIASDLEFADGESSSSFGGRILSRMKRNGLLSRLMAPGNSASRTETLKLYKWADIVLSAPGSFLHDHYAIQPRLAGFELAIELGKTLVILPQSIGPFWKQESIEGIKKTLNKASLICVRESHSVQHLSDCGVNSQLICQTADPIFLWRRYLPKITSEQPVSAKTVALCLRRWPLDDREIVEETISKAAALCRWLINERGCEILFVSTCQGIPGYVDDSEISRKVFNQLPDSCRSSCRIINERLPTEVLIANLAACHAVIGMRLHLDLLAMIGGTPAMALGYEHKSEGIYAQMGLEPYHVEFESPIERWLECADRLLQNIDQLRADLPRVLDRQLALSMLTLDVLASIVREKL